MSTSEIDGEREALVTQVLSARTLPQITAAEQALTRWLQQHPEETGLEDGFEQLSMLKDCAEWLETNPEEAMSVRARQHVRDLVYDARSTPECAEAREALYQCVRDFPDDDMTSELQFLALWEEACAFMEREGTSWDPEPERAPAHA